MPRPQTITLSPDALDRNGITTAETLVAARLDFLINGVLSTGYDRNGIATSQTPLGATAMTLDGTAGLDYTAQGGAHIVVFAVGVDTARTFTVVGTDVDGATISEGITGPGAGLIELSVARFYTIVSVTPDAATAGAIEIGTNGYIDLTQAQHATSYAAGDNASETMTFLGEDRYGNVLTEDTAGPNATTVATVANFQKIYKVSMDVASTGDVEIGVDGTCESGWYQLDYRASDFSAALAVEISGACTYTVEETHTDIQTANFTDTDATAYDHGTLVTQTANLNSSMDVPARAIRLAITIHTSGTATLNIIQNTSY